MPFEVTFKCIDRITKDMVETLSQFEHPFEVTKPEYESVDVEMYGGRTLRMAGKVTPPSIVLHDEKDALLFKLKFFNKVYEVARQETF